MRTTAPLLVVISLAVAAAFFAGSGFNAIVNGDQNTQELENELNQTANESAVGQEEFEGSRRGQGESSIVGLVVSGARNVGKIIGLMLMLPVFINNLGFPWWFAAPVGFVTQIMASIGLIQFTTGKEWL